MQGNDLSIDLLLSLDDGPTQSGEEVQEGSEGDDTNSSDDDQSHPLTPEVKAKRRHDQHRKAVRRLEGHVTSLMDLLPTIQSFCADEHVLKSQERAVSRFPSIKSPSPADAFISQVQDKFTKVNPSLARRLGEAGWERYRRLQRNLARYEKNDSLEGWDSANEDEEAINDEGEPTNFVPASTFHDSGLGISLSTKSQYAASAASHTSFLSTKSATEGVHRVPPTPNEVLKGLPFQCKMCNHSVHGIDSRVKWK